MSKISLQDRNQSDFDSKPVEAQRAHASLLMENQRKILNQRIHLLLANSSRKMANTDEILSTAWRRVDKAIASGRLEAKSDEQFFAFVHGVIRRAILEKARAGRRMTKREQVAHVLREQLRKPESEDKSDKLLKVYRLGELIRSPVDREIILLKGRGHSYPVIAELMKMDPAAVRMRWTRIRKRVREHLGEDS